MDESNHLPEKVYRMDVWKALCDTILALIFGFLGYLLFLVPGYCTSWEWWLLAVLHLGFPSLFLFLLGVMFLLHALEPCGLSVTVSPAGLICRRFGRSVTLSWDSIGGVWSNRSRTTATNRGAVFTLLHQLQNSLETWDVEPKEGRNWILSGLCDLRELGERIEVETCRALLPATLEAYAAGEILDFGRLQISKVGITKETVTLPWEEVTCVGFDSDGWLMIGWKDRPWRQWIGVSPAKVRNLHLLLPLLGEIERQRGANWSVDRRKLPGEDGEDRTRDN